MYFWRILRFLIGQVSFISCLYALPADTVKTGSMAQARLLGKGQITVLWNEIEPFVYRSATGQLMGVEYELMQGFSKFVAKNYAIDLQLRWQEVPVFETIYDSVRLAKQGNVFSVSYFSITPDREMEVGFSPPYMPDLNILVSSQDIPLYNDAVSLLANAARWQGFTVAGTTMKADLLELTKLHPAMPITYMNNDYEVLEHIATHPNTIGYVPLSIYVVALQRGIKVKRQPILQVKRRGFAAIYPRHSDWKPAVDAYFKSNEGRELAAALVRRYLGAEVAAVVTEASRQDSLQASNADVDLLTREREIVTGRLIAAALQNQELAFTRNLITGALILLAVGITILLIMLRSKRRLANRLAISNAAVLAQKAELLKANLQLNQKLAISRLNPHLIFNALSSIQYFVMLNDPKTANQYLSRVSKFIRQVLKNADTPFVDIAAEADMLRQFLNLEQMRFQDVFSFEVQTTGSAGQLPSLLLFPFVEDAIYHRLLAHSKDEPAPHLTVHFANDAAMLSVTIQDNSKVIKEGSKLPSMVIAEQQIDLLNSHYADNIQVTRCLHEGNSHISITIPNSIPST